MWLNLSRILEKFNLNKAYVKNGKNLIFRMWYFNYTWDEGFFRKITKILKKQQNLKLYCHLLTVEPSWLNLLSLIIQELDVGHWIPKRLSWVRKKLCFCSSRCPDSNTFGHTRGILPSLGTNQESPSSNFRVKFFSQNFYLLVCRCRFFCKLW